MIRKMFNLDKTYVDKLTDYADMKKISESKALNEILKDYFDKNKEEVKVRLIYRNENLFNSDIKCKAHCISKDLGMGKGIVVKFNEIYDAKKKMREIASVRQIFVGEAIPIVSKGEIIFQLITKQTIWDKPTLNSLGDSLISLREQLIKKNIKELAIPKIGCGLDRLEWVNVEQIIKSIFNKTDIDIYVYYL